MAKSRNKVLGHDTAVEPEQQAASASWPLWLRLTVSGAILFHIAAQVIYTWAATEPLSALGENLRVPFQPYIVAANLNNGYRFFAPDPGFNSNILRYELFDENDKPLEANEAGDMTGQIPPVDLRVGFFAMRPRLLYHRYFMLTEQAANLLPPPNENIPPEFQERAKESFRARMYSYAQEIMRAHNASKIHLHFVAHRIVPPPRSESDMLPPIDDPASYVEIWDGYFHRKQETHREEIAPAK